MIFSCPKSLCTYEATINTADSPYEFVGIETKNASLSGKFDLPDGVKSYMNLASSRPDRGFEVLDFCLIIIDTGQFRNAIDLGCGPDECTAKWYGVRLACLDLASLRCASIHRQSTSCKGRRIFNNYQRFCQRIRRLEP